MDERYRTTHKGYSLPCFFFYLSAFTIEFKRKMRRKFEWQRKKKKRASPSLLSSQFRGGPSDSFWALPHPKQVNFRSRRLYSPPTLLQQQANTVATRWLFNGHPANGQKMREEEGNPSLPELIAQQFPYSITSVALRFLSLYLSTVPPVIFI